MSKPGSTPPKVWANRADFNAWRGAWPGRPCTCYLDDYSMETRFSADCPHHGDKLQGADKATLARRKRLGCTHPIGTPCWGPRGANTNHVNPVNPMDPPANPKGAPMATMKELQTDRNPPPAHYSGAIEPWDYWAAHNLDPWEANAVKYITRAGRKDTATAADDYRKARDYLNYLILREENKRDSK